MESVILINIVLIFIFSNSFAQTTGKISGMVTDAESGEPLPGVNIVLQGTQLGAASDDDGNYVILNVPPGEYDITFSMIGYKQYIVKNITVSINRTVNIDAQLVPSSIRGESVVVYADEIKIKKDQTSSIRNISSKEISTLPIENVKQIVNLQPGVVGRHFRGGRGSEVSYMIDGVDITNSLNRESEAVEINPSAVNDMEVITGTFNAEYGNAMSGVVNIVTKEGGDELEGTASVNSGNYITSHRDIFKGVKNNQLNIEDYKFSLSGPLLNKRIKFLINGRYFQDRGYLYGINYYNVKDYSNFVNYPDNYYTEATGDSSYVSLNDEIKTNLLGKLTFKPLQQLKTSILYTYNRNKFQNYNHQYRFNPHGLSTNHENSHMLAFYLNHSLSQKAFYELKLSYNKYYAGNYLYKDPNSPNYIHDLYQQSAGSWFYTGGQQKGHTRHNEREYSINFDFHWQVTRSHNIQTGFDLKRNILEYKWAEIRNKYYATDKETEYKIDTLENGRTERVYQYYEPVIKDDDNTTYADFYTKEPITGAAYIQDKMEFHSMVVNVGLRLDYFDPNTTYPTNWRNPGNQDQFEADSMMSDYLSVDPHLTLSPRLGLSYSLGEYSLLRFSYGHFLQDPPLTYFYQNTTKPFVTENAFVGNPLLKPQKTVQYEIGYSQQLTDNMDIEVVVFYRDIYELTSSKQVYTYSQIPYGLYINKDYGNARGLELKHRFRLGNVFVNTNYSLQYARGVADNPAAAFTRAGNNMDPVNKLIPLAWEQRHTLNVTTGYNSENYGATFTFYYNSGQPYNWNPISENPLATLNLLPNNQYKPSQYNLDLHGYYNLFTIGNINGRLILLVRNVLDHLNENSVNQQTGHAYSGIIRPVDRASHKHDITEYEDIIQNPSMYSAPRIVKLGLKVEF